MVCLDSLVWRLRELRAPKAWKPTQVNASHCERFVFGIAADPNSWAAFILCFRSFGNMISNIVPCKPQMVSKCPPDSHSSWASTQTFVLCLLLLCFTYDTTEAESWGTWGETMFFLSMVVFISSGTPAGSWMGRVLCGTWQSFGDHAINWIYQFAIWFGWSWSAATPVIEFYGPFAPVWLWVSWHPTKIFNSQTVIFQNAIRYLLCPLWGHTKNNHSPWWPAKARMSGNATLHPRQFRLTLWDQVRKFFKDECGDFPEVSL